MSRRPDFDEAVVIETCRRFLEKRETPKEIADYFNENADLGHPFNRETVYALLRRAIRREYIQINAPAHEVLQKKICRHFEIGEESVHVVHARGEAARLHVADAAAQLVIELIEKLQEHKEAVHLGLGGGGTVLEVSRSLARRLGQQGSISRLGLHALSSGFDVTNPRTAPISFFGYFDGMVPEIDYVGLFAPAAVGPRTYKTVMENAGVAVPVQRRPEIDIVITSLAAESDEHGELNRFLKLDEQMKKRRNILRDAGWVGDLSYRPYSREGPIKLKEGVRAVTLFELEDLVEMVSVEGKHVVIVAAPCGQCGKTKGEALRPLLTRSELALWTHCVMDMQTAQSLLPRKDAPKV